MIIIIDFDNTIVNEKYPDAGHLFLLANEVINGWYEDGNAILINTCRAGKYEGMAVDILEKNNIPFNYVNCNMPKTVEQYKMDCRKLSGDLNIDNKNLGGLPLAINGDVDWIEIDLRVRKHKLYEE